MKLLLNFFSDGTNFYHLVEALKKAHEFLQIFSEVLKLWNKRETNEPSLADESWKKMDISLNIENWIYPDAKFTIGTI